MNYFKIVMQGYHDRNSRKHLERYFYRKFKEAENNEFFEADEFFDGCLGIVKNLEGRIKRDVNDWRNILESELYQAKNGLLQYKNMEGKTFEQQRQKTQGTIEFCEKELASLSENDFPLLQNGRLLLMGKKDLLQIKLAIENVFQGYKNSTQKALETETELSNFFDLDKIELSKVDEIQKTFKGIKGKQEAALIFLLRDRYELIEIIRSSKTKSLKKFCELINGNSGTYEAVRKCFDGKNNWNYQETDEAILSIDKRLNKILKQNQL